MRRTLGRLGWLVVMLLLALGSAPRAQAEPQAGPFVVNSSLDELDSNTADGICRTDANECTLRAAVMQANATTGAGVTIIIPAGTFTLTRPYTGTDGVEGGDLNLTTPAAGDPIITIQGAGAGATILDAGQVDRMFDVENNRTAVISGVTIRGGYRFDAAGGGISVEGTLTLIQSRVTDNDSNSGGGIFANGTLNVTESLVDGNRAAYGGGVLNSDGTVHMVRSTVSGNYASGQGGGIFNSETTYVRESTISGNTADVDGAGILNQYALFVVNSTISQNDTNGDGGGLYNLSGYATNIFNSTVVFNGADADFDEEGGSGGGFFNEAGGTVSIRNTLVAGNTVHNAPVYDDCQGSLGSYGFNLIGIDADAVNCSVSIGSGSWTYINSLALLGPLAENGGPTRTHALLLGSNAINATDVPYPCTDETSATLVTDQRGAARIFGPRCDIGAFEYRTPLLLPFLTR